MEIIEFTNEDLELIETAYWVTRTVEEHHWPLDEALENYKMSKEDYDKYKDY